MFNDIHIGPLTIHMYGVMMALGFLSALFLCLRRSKKFELSEDHLWNLFFSSVVGGLLGAKVLYWIVELPAIIKDPSVLLDFRNGFVVYGGIIGGVFAGWLYCRRKKLSFFDYFDLIMPAVSLAQGFGRIGCFCAGCCYGAETDSAFSVVFHHSLYAPNGVKLIPTQLISSAADVTLCLLLCYYASKRPHRGRVGAAWMIFYSLGRFAIEFLRNDHRGSLGIFSTSQIISFGIAIGGVVMWFAVKKLVAPKKFATSADIENKADQDPQ